MNAFARWCHTFAFGLTVIISASSSIGCNGLKGLVGKKSDSQSLVAAAGSQDATATKTPEAVATEQKEKVCPVTTEDKDDVEYDDYDDDKIVESEDDEINDKEKSDDSTNEYKDCEKTAEKTETED